MDSNLIIKIYSRIVEAFNTDNAAEIGRQLGIARQSVYKWRDGENPPDLERVIEIARVTNRSLDWLLTGQPEQGQTNRSEIEAVNQLSESDFMNLYKAYIKTSPEKARVTELLIKAALQELDEYPENQAVAKDQGRPG